MCQRLHVVVYQLLPGAKCSVLSWLVLHDNPSVVQVPHIYHIRQCRAQSVR